MSQEGGQAPRRLGASPRSCECLYATISAIVPLIFTFNPAAKGTDFCGGTSTVLASAAVAVHGVAVRLQRPQTLGLFGFCLIWPITLDAWSSGPVGSMCRR